MNLLGIREKKQTEGKVARLIEQQTAKLPSDMFLYLAAGAIGTAFVLEMSGKEEKGHFVGQWVAPILLLGLYNKIVKVAGSDRTSRILSLKPSWLKR